MHSKPTTLWSLLGRLGLVLTSVLLTFVGLELCTRWALSQPFLTLRDFRQEHAAKPLNDAIEYDRLLGWRLKPFIRSPGFNTPEFGFRSNGGTEQHVQPGGVLAVGASFTAGSDVIDEETWPAQLAQMTGWNVNNAGQGGYHADQAILLSEQLLPLVRPQVLVVDLVDGMIIGTGYASSGWPKPYFTIENGQLVHHNFPVPQTPSLNARTFDIRRLLGRSAVFDQFMTRLFPNYWFNSQNNSIVPIETDEIGVTCRLLERLKREADDVNTRMVLYLQYPAPEIVDASRLASAGPLYRLQRGLKRALKPWLMNTPPGAPDWHDAVFAVAGCARQFQITIVDELTVLQTAFEENHDSLRTYYVTQPDGLLGHKTKLGNLAVATLLESTIRKLGVLAN
jgi:hypothetical protein